MPKAGRGHPERTPRRPAHSPTSADGEPGRRRSYQSDAALDALAVEWSISRYEMLACWLPRSEWFGRALSIIGERFHFHMPYYRLEKKYFSASARDSISLAACWSDRWHTSPTVGSRPTTPLRKGHETGGGRPQELALRADRGRRWKTASIMMSLVQTAEAAGVNVKLYPRDVLQRIATRSTCGTCCLTPGRSTSRPMSSADETRSSSPDSCVTSFVEPIVAAGATRSSAPDHRATGPVPPGWCGTHMEPKRGSPRNTARRRLSTKRLERRPPRPAW